MKRLIILLLLGLVALLMPAAAQARSTAASRPQTSQDTISMSAADFANLCNSGNGIVTLTGVVDILGGTITLTQSCEVHVPASGVLDIGQVNLTSTNNFVIDGGTDSGLIISQSSLEVSGSLVLQPGGFIPGFEDEMDGDQGYLVITQSDLSASSELRACLAERVVTAGCWATDELCIFIALLLGTRALSQTGSSSHVLGGAVGSAAAQ